MVLRIRIPWPFDHLLKQEVHKQKQRLGLEHKVNTLLIVRTIEVLMHASVFHEHHIARAPLETLAIVNIIAAPLENIEDGTVEMPMLLAGSLG